MRRVLHIRPTVTNHMVSVDFNGVDEGMRNSGQSILGFGNAFSIMAWLKPGEVSFATNRTIYQFIPTIGSVNRIDFRHSGNLAGDPLVVSLFTSGGTIFKAYNYDNLINASQAWQQIFITWDGTNMLLYSNGTFIEPTTKSTDNAGTMTDSNRRSAFGFTAAGATPWSGRGHSLAIWDQALGPGQIIAAYNGGDGRNMDLRIVGNGPIHWWKLGFAGDIGKDHGSYSANLVDINANSANITESDDVVSDAP